MSSDAENLARELKHQDWEVEYDSSKRQWTARHPHAQESIQWKRGVRKQRVLDQVEAALGLQPHRATNALKRKDKQSKARAQARQQVQAALSREEARDRAVHDVFLVHQAETSVLPDVLKRHFDALSLTTTYTAVERARKYKLSGRQIQQALQHPISVLKGHNDCAVYVGGDCKVVLSPIGYIVSVIPVK